MSDGMNKPYSEETGRLIDDEVKRIVDEQWERTYNLLAEKKDILEKLALQLLEKETIERQDLIECLGKSFTIIVSHTVARGSHSYRI